MSIQMIVSATAIVLLGLAYAYRFRAPNDRTDYVAVGSIIASAFFYHQVEVGSALWLIPQCLLTGIVTMYIVTTRRHIRPSRAASRRRHSE